LENPNKNKLLNFIFELSGDKIVSLYSEGEQEEFDISNDGVIGYRGNHVDYFDDLLDESIEYGSIIVRQFTSIQSHKSKDGAVIPYKKIYGFIGNAGEIRVLTKKELESSIKDPETGDPKEKNRSELFTTLLTWDKISELKYNYTEKNFNHKFKRGMISFENVKNELDQNDIYLGDLELYYDTRYPLLVDSNTISRDIESICRVFVRWVIEDNDYEIEASSKGDIITPTNGSEDFTKLLDGKMETWLMECLTGVGDDYSDDNTPQTYGDLFISVLSHRFGGYYDEAKDNPEDMELLIEIANQNIRAIFETVAILNTRAVFVNHVESEIEEMRREIEKEKQQNESLESEYLEILDHFYSYGVDFSRSFTIMDKNELYSKIKRGSEDATLEILESAIKMGVGISSEGDQELDELEDWIQGIIVEEYNKRKA
jgi:hypothetical protein